MSKPLDPKRKTVLQLSVVILTMGTLAWASVPLYDWFCRVTGYGGTTQVADRVGVDDNLDVAVFSHTVILVDTVREGHAEADAAAAARGGINADTLDLVFGAAQ